MGNKKEVLIMEHILPADTDENTIYLVCGAEDYRHQPYFPCAAFTDLDNANKFSSMYNGQNVVAIELDQWKMIIELGYRCWDITIKISNGEVTVHKEKYFVNTPELYDLYDIFVETQPKHDRICMYCWARNEEEAIKRAKSIRREYLMEESHGDI